MEGVWNLVACAYCCANKSDLNRRQIPPTVCREPHRARCTLREEFNLERNQVIKRAPRPPSIPLSYHPFARRYDNLRKFIRIDPSVDRRSRTFARSTLNCQEAAIYDYNKDKLSITNESLSLERFLTVPQILSLFRLLLHPVNERRLILATLVYRVPICIPCEERIDKTIPRNYRSILPIYRRPVFLSARFERRLDLERPDHDPPRRGFPRFRFESLSLGDDIRDCSPILDQTPEETTFRSIRNNQDRFTLS